jgi:hypothetical protein
MPRLTGARGRHRHHLVAPSSRQAGEDAALHDPAPDQVNLILLVHNLIQNRVLLRMAGVEL